jgi:transcriptional regulator with XRE-family HTH domain
VETWISAADSRPLRRLRHEEDSPDDLAYEVRLLRAHVSKIERAVTYVGLEIIGKFAEVLKVHPIEFLQAPARKSRKT